MALTHIHNRAKQPLKPKAACTLEEAKAWARQLALEGKPLPGKAGALQPAAQAEPPRDRLRNMIKAEPMVRSVVAQQRGAFTARHVHHLCPEITQSAVCNQLAALTEAGELTLLNPGHRPKTYRRASPGGN